MAKALTRKQKEKQKAQKKIKRDSKETDTTETYRQSQVYKEKEKLRIQNKRKDNAYKDNENIKKASRRIDNKVKEKENALRKEKREEEEYRELENKNRRQKREDNEYREEESEKKKLQRLDEAIREKENTLRRQKREDDEYREEESEKKKMQRLDEAFRENENMLRRQKREDDEYREEESEKKKMQRLDEAFREKENMLRRQKREDDEYRQEESEKKKLERLNEAFKENENALRRQKREDETYRDHDNENRRQTREDDEYRENESVKKKMQRLDEAFREKENTLRRQKREVEAYREHENENRHQKRDNDEYREEENERHKLRRSDINIVGKENELRKRKRTNVEYQEQEKQSKKFKRISNIESAKEKENERKAKQRADAQKRKAERKVDRARKVELRKNNLLKTKEQDINTLKKTLNQANCAKIRFYDAAKLGPDVICCCCERLMFKHATVKFDSDSKYDDNFWEKIYNFESESICKTCQIKVRNGLVPKLASSNGLKYPELPQCIQIISPLEERLVSPILSFIQITELQPHALNAQLGIRGSVVHVASEINDMVRVLPRRFDQLSVIQIKLKRSLEHKTNYMYETIRPSVVVEAAKYLKNTPVYLKHKIEIDDKWLEGFDSNVDKIDFIVDDNDRVTKIIDEVESSDSEYESDSTDGGDEVLLMNNDRDTKGIKSIAPGQGKLPLPSHMIEDVDEQCFPKIFAGEFFDKNKLLTYANRGKLEAMHRDRRSCIPSRILYISRQKLEKSMMSEINICLRKVKATEKVTAQQIIMQGKVDELVAHDAGYRVMSNVRSTPAFWESKKKEVFAMIRQLDKPTMFMTLSAAERQWPELLVILKKCNDGQVITFKEALDMSDFEKTELIRNDAVTCARYFDYKMHLLMKLLRSPAGPFGLFYVEDSYQRVEFQLRGSPHEHCILYLKDAPIYEEGNEESKQSVIEFIDKFITCNYDKNDPFVDLQRHKHTQTCHKGTKNKNKCRFNYPIPMMAKTCIIDPIPKEEKTEKMATNLTNIRSKMHLFYKTEVSKSFDEVLKELNLVEEEYILAIRSSLKRTQVFLKRKSTEVAINAYNRDILHLFQSNMDMQYILNAYACVSYIINYISKMESGVTKLLRDAAKDIQNGNQSLKDQMRKYCNIFINANLMSSQEAAYHVLGLSLSKCSRVCVFIPTAAPENRARMMKPLPELAQLGDSEDIFKQNSLEKYAKRPHSDEMNNLCLADFVANYTLKTTKKVEEDDLQEDNIPDENENFNMQSRRKSKIIRYINFNKIQDQENYFREQVLLFHPWRDEQTEVVKRNCEEIFMQFEDSIAANRAKYTKITHEELNEAMENAQKENQEVYDEEAEDANADRIPADQEIDLFGQAGDVKPTDKAKTRFVAPKLESHENIKDLMTKLNKEQREFVMHIYHSFKNGFTPFQVFLSGSAGVGKSLVIKVLYQLLTKTINECPGVQSDTIKIVLCAFSGLAAFLIGGTTIHTAFALPVNQSGSAMPELSSDVANTLRAKMIDVKLLIIDEISMVGYKMLAQIDKRLRQIMGQKSLYFGGVSVMAVGDFNQLPPVGQSSVYKIGKDPLSILAGNVLWTQFQYYELNIIMRQQNNLAFTKALNNMAKGAMTPDDIALIRSRSNMDDRSIPEQVTRLYTTNCMVDAQNRKRIENNPGILYKSFAVDNILSKKLTKDRKEYLIENQKNKSRKDMNGLDYEVLLKTEIKYMITSNIDIEDGLVNGTRGVLKLIELSTKTNAPINLWFEFESERVGVQMRTKVKEYAKRENINKKWVPVKKLSCIVSIKESGSYQITRTQFPVVPAEALTVHKSQGQSMVEVCVDLKNSKHWTREKLYVAISRVTSLEGLYIIGTFNPPAPPNPTSDLAVDLKRLKSVDRMKLCYNSLENQNGTIIIYQNVQSLGTSYRQILCDPWYTRANLLILAETATLGIDQYSFPDYSLIFRTDEKATVRNQRGIMIFAKPDADDIQVLEHILSNLGTSHIDLVHVKINNLNVVTGYKSPKTNATIFMDNLKKLCSGQKQKVNVIIGDFNFDAYQQNSFIEVNMRTNFKLKQAISYGVSTTNMNTQIDVVFVNEETNCIAGTYDSYFSDHKAIYTVINSQENHSVTSQSQKQKARDQTENNIMTEESISKISNLPLDDEAAPEILNKTDSHVVDISSDEENQEIVYDPKLILLEIKYLKRDSQFYQRVEIVRDKHSSYFNDIKRRNIGSTGFTYNRSCENQIAPNRNASLAGILKQEHHIISIRGDGNCLFNSLSFLLHGTQIFAAELRLLAILTIIENKEFFKLMCEQNIEFSSDIEPAARLISLIIDIATDQVYGNEGAIMALCIALARPIISVTPLTNCRPENPIYGFKTGNENDRNRPLFILLHSAGTAGAHYEALCPKSSNLINFEDELINLTEKGNVNFNPAN